MLPLVALFLLIGQSMCATTGDREDLTLSTEAESWMTVNLKVPRVEGWEIPSEAARIAECTPNPDW